MNGITELAKLLKERENSDGYSPMFGTVIELPNTKIHISDKVILTDSHITLCINLKEQNADGEYLYYKAAEQGIIRKSGVASQVQVTITGIPENVISVGDILLWWNYLI